MKRRRILTGLAVAVGLLLTAKAGRAIYWNSLSAEEKVEKMTDRMGRWLALSDGQKPLVLALNRTLAAEKGDVGSQYLIASMYETGTGVNQNVQTALDWYTAAARQGDFVAKELEIYLHKNAKTADAMLKRILQSERERKEIAGIKKLANERAKKANLHNKKLRDCRFHFDDENQMKNFH